MKNAFVLLLAGLSACLLARPSLSGEANLGSQAALSPKAGGNREALFFRNGDILFGALESIQPRGQIRWRHADVDQPIEFQPENVSEIRFPSRPSARPVGVNSSRLQLSNGDELEGIDLVLNDDQGTLQTWYGGAIAIPRKFIQGVVPLLPEGATLFEGPTGYEGWTIGKVVSALGDAGEWKYSNGAFYATNAASIARDLNLPDSARIEFDLAWKGVFQLAVALFTDYLQPINLANKDTEPQFAGFYSLQLNSFSANLLPVKKNDPLRYLGQVSVPPFNQKNSAHVEIRASKLKRTVSLHVDGQLIKQWIDTEDFAGQGKGMRFVHQGQGKVKLSGFRVAEWDGLGDEKLTFNTDGKLDIAKLRNGDKVLGLVQQIQGTNLTIATGDTKLVIPLSRVRQIEMAGQKVERLAADTSNARAVFKRGGVVSLRLEKWEHGKVFGTSSTLGALAFDGTAFSRLELDLQP